ncbi:MAG: hypothetical protein HYT48_02450 [Candidatus Vogelbacteria bacterium]|nr:hypothetical protein [Candidatus Vogelbacteria bacterium]
MLNLIPGVSALTDVLYLVVVSVGLVVVAWEVIKYARLRNYSVFGIIAFASTTLAIIGGSLFFIPILGILFPLGLALGVLFALVGIIDSLVRKKPGLALSLLTMIMSVTIIILFAVALSGLRYL